MADVASNLAAWSATTNSNSPAGTATVGTGMDDNIREVQGVLVRGLSNKGADIASASTTDIGAVEGLMHDITGTTGISSFGTVRTGIWKILKFEGALTLTHNATSLILLSGGNRTTADGDVGIYISEGSGNWREVYYSNFNSLVEDTAPVLNTDYIETYDASATGKKKILLGRAGGGVLSTEQASTAGTSIDFTSIPSWVKRITIEFVGVSLSGSANPLIQIGDSGGIENSGYLGSCSAVSTGVAASNFTAGFGINSADASNVLHGAVTISMENASSFTWVCSGTLGQSNAAQTYFVGGSKSLSAALDRVRVTTSNGTDTFDAGAINILYT